MNRKWIALLLSCALVLMLAAACGRNNDKANNGNDSVNNDTTNNGSGMNNTAPGNTGNTNVPGNMTPGNDLNGNGNDGNTDGNIGEHNDPVFPDSLATTDADVAVTDLFDTLGLAVTDLETAMRDMTNMGENGNYAYRHNLLGQESEVSYGFDQKDVINKVTVKAPAGTADEWRQELSGTLGAKEAEGEQNSWTYNENKVKVDDKGDHVVITIEKNA